MQQLFDQTLDRLTSSQGRRFSFLLAVSGGVDSMSMLRLFCDSKASCLGKMAVAHVNFSLRGIESDGDEKLVREQCSAAGVECFTRRFDTATYADEHSVSIEMAARELRYNWFEELRAEKGFDFIAVAHNLNDSVETLFLNLLRGTGIQGAGGIRSLNGRIVRPLLEFSREEILEFASGNAIPFRTDSTNLNSDFSRNRIRNEVFPQLEKINPSFLRSIETSMRHFSQAQDILDSVYKECSESASLPADAPCEAAFDIEKLRSGRFRNYTLYRILAERGFNSAQTDAVNAGLESEASGKRFFSATHLVLKDRGALKIYPLSKSDDGFKVDVQIIGRDADFDPKSLPQGTLCADADLLSLPLACRSWREGDRFRPFGMKGWRKLSDFFTDCKFDLEQKRSQRVVTTTDNEGVEQIVCIAAVRLDDRFKVTSQTHRIALIR